MTGHIDWSAVPHVAADDATAAKYRLHDGDIVLARTGASTGASAYVKDPPPAVFASYLVRLQANPQFDARFLAYYLRSDAFWTFIRGVLGDKSAQPNASASTMTKAPLRAPKDKDEQRAIAHILGTLDDKIELNRRMSETLEAMARALFKSWFVDFDPVRAKAEGRDPGLPKPLADLFPARLVDSELGEIPEGWEVGPLGELVDTVKGRSYRSEELVNSDTALVTLKSFARGGGYRSDGLKSFAGTYKPEQAVTLGEVVIACTDVTQAAEVIGRPAIVRGTGGYRRLVASLDTLIVRPLDSRISRAFLYFLGGTEAFVTHTYAHTTGTTVLHLAKRPYPRSGLPALRGSSCRCSTLWPHRLWTECELSKRRREPSPPYATRYCPSSCPASCG